MDRVRFGNWSQSKIFFRKVEICDTKDNEDPSGQEKPFLGTTWNFLHRPIIYEYRHFLPA
jgi:hypothetical protein